MSTHAQSFFVMEPGGIDAVDTSLRSIARQHVEHYHDRRARRQHIIAALRGKIATLRTLTEESNIEPTALEMVLTNLLHQHTLLDELERNN